MSLLGLTPGLLSKAGCVLSLSKHTTNASHCIGRDPDPQSKLCVCEKCSYGGVCIELVGLFQALKKAVNSRLEVTWPSSLSSVFRDMLVPLCVVI